MVRTPRLKRYLERNKQFQAFLPNSLHDFFLSYLQTHCQGASTSAQFRVLIYELKTLEEQGITIANPLKAYNAERSKSLKSEFGATNPDDICFRFKVAYPTWDAKMRTISCQYCKDSKKPEYAACQAERAELRKKLI